MAQSGLQSGHVPRAHASRAVADRARADSWRRGKTDIHDYKFFNFHCGDRTIVSSIRGAGADTPVAAGPIHVPGTTPKAVERDRIAKTSNVGHVMPTSVLCCGDATAGAPRTNTSPLRERIREVPCTSVISVAERIHTIPRPATQPVYPPPSKRLHESSSGGSAQS